MMNHRSIVRVSVLASVLSLSAFAVGCGSSVEQPQSQATAVQKAPLATQTHGVVKVFGEALGEVALRPEQRTELETLAAAADTRHATLLGGKKDIVLTLADQVEAGTIDPTALQPKLDAIVAGLEKSRPDDTAALTRVHAMLDADQRNQLVDALESKWKAKHGLTGEEGLKGHVGGLMKLKQLYDDLNLTDAQRSQIKDIITSSRDGHRMNEMKAHLGEHKQALEAFRGDTFDAAALAPSPDAIRARVATGSTRFASFAVKVLPILTPDQRKIAADKLRTIANSDGDLPFAN